MCFSNRDEGCSASAATMFPSTLPTAKKRSAVVHIYSKPTSSSKIFCTMKVATCQKKVLITNLYHYNFSTLIGVYYYSTGAIYHSIRLSFLTHLVQMLNYAPKTLIEGENRMSIKVELDSCINQQDRL